MGQTTQVRNDSPAARIQAWEQRTRWVIVAAALAPFVVQPLFGSNAGVLLVVDMASWLVFAVDLAVHLRINPRYWRTGRGVFDIAIVVLTFPWYVFPAVGNTAFLSVFRLARILRLLGGVFADRLGTALRRLGRLGAALLVASLFSAALVWRAEPEESGFETIGDALWWSMVSFTTVGYGDLFPVTPAGRLAGGLMMIMGLAALGTVSAVLASTLVGADRDQQDDVPQDDVPLDDGGAAASAGMTAIAPAAPVAPAALDNEVLAEVRALRDEVARLNARLGG